MAINTGALSILWFDLDLFRSLWERFVPDDPFQGLYRADGFDLAILIPYFLVLVLLSVYGVHRYSLVYLYLRTRHKAPIPSKRFERLPSVTVQLPLYNERYVVGRLLKAATALDYPRERLEIQVLDDSTDETTEIAKELVREYAARGHRVRYLHRSNRRGFKAGALAEGLKVAAGEFIAIFDADFVPPRGILRQMVEYFTDPEVGLVQGRWTWLNRDYSLLTRVESLLLDAHFTIEHGGRSFSGLFFNFNGTAGMWRRSAIESSGGWEHDTLTEDTDLSYRAQMRGWRFVYAPHIVCPSELPVEMNAFKAQQARWAKGLIQNAKKLLPRLWRSPLPLRVKVEAFFHLTANVCYPLMVALAYLLLPAMILRAHQGWFEVLSIDLPLFLAATGSVSTFYLVAQRELDPQNWKKSIKFVPLLMAIGIGLSLSNTKAVFEALLGWKSGFARTPKYCVEKGKEPWESKKYSAGWGWTPVVELVHGGYFTYIFYYAATGAHYFVTPFLILFVTGYFYMGGMSLLQKPLRRLLPAARARTLLSLTSGEETKTPPPLYREGSH